MQRFRNSYILSPIIQRVLKYYGSAIWIILLGLFLRVLWAIAVPVDPVSDSYAYDTFARNLATGQGYGWKNNEPTAYWPVGTSAVYAIFYWILGHTYWPIVVFNLLLAVISIGGCIYLAELWFNRQIAIVTGLLLALWPSQIQFTTVLASELLFNALIVVALALWFSENLSLRSRVIWVGIVLAAASYVRPIALLMPILFLLWRYIKTQELFKTVTATLVMLVLMAGLIAPWSIRNTLEFGQFVTISTNGGANLWMGNNPASTGGYMDLPSEVNGMNEAQRDKYLKALATAHIKEKPLLFVFRTIKRTIDTHSRESIGVAWNEKGLIARYGNWILTPLKVINQIYWMAMLGLGLIGIVLMGHQYGWLTMLTSPMVLLWGYFAAVHAVIVAQDRYHFPSIPMIAILAASTVVYWFNRNDRSRQKSKQELAA
jgi:4-amino-4-deoxy-L-arabinose transferase-like glycosyltransferase